MTGYTPDPLSHKKLVSPDQQSAPPLSGAPAGGGLDHTPGRRRQPTPRRLRSETSEVKLQWHDDSGRWCEEDMAVCIAVDDSGSIQEMNFVMRPGKQGATLDQMFANLGIQLSRIIQDRDPESGDPRP